jgi:hypothetical protein
MSSAVRRADLRQVALARSGGRRFVAAAYALG